LFGLALSRKILSLTTVWLSRGRRTHGKRVKRCASPTENELAPIDPEVVIQAAKAEIAETLVKAG
jgi:hypothetical protein